MSLKDEIAVNFETFNSVWRQEANATLVALDSKKSIFSESYARITSFQAWRTSVIEPSLDVESAAFFFEAQNDLLVSHCLAHLGSFRQALKSLRSCIENVLFTIYYKDHPVEFQKWEAGAHKLGFSELATYLSSHPKLIGSSETNNGIAQLKEEYSTLSKAVHSSAKQFRMTTDLAENRLWINDGAAVSKWATRENATIRALNLLLLYFFSSSLQGAANINLRRVIAITLPKTRFAQIKADLKVNLDFKE